MRRILAGLAAGTAGELKAGWKVVLAALVGVGCGATGLSFYTMGLFVKPLSAEFGWSRGAISGAALCLQAGLIVTAPFIGRLIDKVGVRKVALTSLAGLALGFAALTLIGGSVFTLYGGWLLLAALGCGTTPVVWTRTINAWFDEARGLALGMTLMGTGLAAVLGPILVGKVIAAQGWRTGYLAVAATVLIVALPLVFALLRETPPVAAGEAPKVRTGATVGEAMRTRRFWQCALGFFLIGLPIAALIVHMVPMLTDRGLPQAEAARMASGLGLAIIAGRLCVGALVDRFHAPYVGFGFLLLPVIGCVLLAQGHPALAIIALGLAAGAEVDLLAYLNARYFGLRSYGEIYGWQLSMFSLSAGLGPIAMGAAQDHFGSYTPGLYVCAALILAGAALIALLGRFDRAEA